MNRRYWKFSGAVFAIPGSILCMAGGLYIPKATKASDVIACWGLVAIGITFFCLIPWLRSRNAVMIDSERIVFFRPLGGIECEIVLSEIESYDSKGGGEGEPIVKLFNKRTIPIPYGSRRRKEVIDVIINRAQENSR